MASTVVFDDGGSSSSESELDTARTNTSRASRASSPLSTARSSRASSRASSRESSRSPSPTPRRTVPAASTVTHMRTPSGTQNVPIPTVTAEDVAAMEARKRVSRRRSVGHVRRLSTISVVSEASSEASSISVDPRGHVVPHSATLTLPGAGVGGGDARRHSTGGSSGAAAVTGAESRARAQFKDAVRKVRMANRVANNVRNKRAHRALTRFGGRGKSSMRLLPKVTDAARPTHFTARLTTDEAKCDFCTYLMPVNAPQIGVEQSERKVWKWYHIKCFCRLCKAEKVDPHEIRMIKGYTRLSVSHQALVRKYMPNLPEPHDSTLRVQDKEEIVEELKRPRKAVGHGVVTRRVIKAQGFFEAFMFIMALAASPSHLVPSIAGLVSATKGLRGKYASARRWLRGTVWLALLFMLVSVLLAASAHDGGAAAWTLPACWSESRNETLVALAANCTGSACPDVPLCHYESTIAQRENTMVFFQFLLLPLRLYLLVQGYPHQLEREAAAKAVADEEERLRKEEEFATRPIEDIPITYSLDVV